MKKIILETLNLFNLDLKRYPSIDKRRRMNLMKSSNIDLVFDVGANIGQFGQELRRLGYKGRIESFEPIKSVFDSLYNNSLKDSNWGVHHFGLGDVSGSSIINISRNFVSSSILSINDDHLKGERNSEVVDSEQITVNTLEDVYDDLVKSHRNIYLKIDTQGFEMKVLKGGKSRLKQIRLIQLEISLTSLYDGESTMFEVLSFMNSLGFVLVSIENGFEDYGRHRLLQIDALFLNENLKLD